MKNIVLIGFMGAGKSLISNKLGMILKRQVVSTDNRIEQSQHKAISEIFQNFGEAYFRGIERKVIKEICEKTGLIIDCGGGAILDVVNVSNLKKNGLLIYLSTTPEVIYKRVKDQRHRPLLNAPDPLKKIKELLAIRKPHYEQAANYCVDTTDKNADQVVEAILKFLPND